MKNSSFYKNAAVFSLICALLSAGGPVLGEDHPSPSPTSENIERRMEGAVTEYLTNIAKQKYENSLSELLKTAEKAKKNSLNRAFLTAYSKLIDINQPSPVDHFAEIIALDPSASPDAYFALGNLYQIGPRLDYEKALKAYNRAIKGNPQFVAAYINKALTEMAIASLSLDKKTIVSIGVQGILPEEMENRLTKALDTLDTTLSLDPTPPHRFCIHYNKGIILTILSREREAIDALTKAIELGGMKYPDVAASSLSLESEKKHAYLTGSSPLCAVGSTYIYYLEMTSNTLENKKVFSMDPELRFIGRENDPLAFAYYQRGVAYSRKNLKEYDKAIEDFTEAITLNPHVDKFYKYRSLASTEKGDNRYLEDALESSAIPFRLEYLFYQKNIKELSQRLENPKNFNPEELSGMKQVLEGLKQQAASYKKLIDMIETMKNKTGDKP